MRRILTISIDDEMEKKVDSLAKENHISRSELIKKALRKYVYIQEFRKMREGLIPYAEAKGYFTDEDIFKDFS